MAITGVSAISGQQIIAAGAVSAKNAAMDSNGGYLTAKLTKASADTLYQPIGNYQTAGNYLTTGDSAEFYTTANESGFATTSQLQTVSGEITGLIPTDLFTKASADTLYQPIGNYQTAGDYLTTGDSANFYTTANESGFATTSQLQAVSGDITGLIPTDLFTKASADTLYQPIGNYQTAGDYLTTGDSANFYTTANESGFITTAGQTVTSTAGDGTYITAINAVPISGKGDFTGLFQAQYGTTTYNDIKNAVDNNKIVYCKSGGRMAFLAYSGNNNYEFQYYRSLTGHTTAAQGDQVFVYTINNANTWSVTTRNTYTEIKPSAGLASAFTNGTAAKLAFSVSDDILNATATVAANSAAWDAKVGSADVTGTAQYGLTTGGWTEITAGGDVPEGVLVESGLEYNAVNEISGYNGSAIAQYGAEKQWLVHDDTLLHVANSAQYALGVNVTALQRLMGIDETLLYSGELGDIGGNITINEPMSSFNKIGVYMAPGVTDNPAISYYPTETLSPSRIAFKVQWAYNYMQEAYLKLVPTGDDVTFKYDGNTLIQYKHNATGVSTTINDTAYLLSSSKLRIYGIGRKEV